MKSFVDKNARIDYKYFAMLIPDFVTQSHDNNRKFSITVLLPLALFVLFQHAHSFTRKQKIRWF